MYERPYRHMRFSRPPMPRPQRPVLSKATFDAFRAEKFMGRCNPHSDDTELSQALLQRNDVITPSNSKLHQELSGFVEALFEAVDVITIKHPIGKYCIREFHLVGSMKIRTILEGHNTVDFVMILQSLPETEMLATMADALVEIMKQKDPKADVEKDVTNAGFMLSLNKRVHSTILITTTGDNLAKLDAATMISRNQCHAAYSSVKHCRWIESSNDHGLIPFIRLLKDARNRFDGLMGLSSRMIDLLASYAIVNSNVQPIQSLPLSTAYKRAFQLLASGIFLVGSSSLTDPVSHQHRMNEMTFEQMDDVCRTAQAIVRLLNTSDSIKLVVAGTPLPVPTDGSAYRLFADSAVEVGVRVAQNATQPNAQKRSNDDGDVGDGVVVVAAVEVNKNGTDNNYNDVATDNGKLTEDD